MSHAQRTPYSDQRKESRFRLFSKNALVSGEKFEGLVSVSSSIKGEGIFFGTTGAGPVEPLTTRVARN